MAWRRPSDKPFSEPMMFSLLTHICVTQYQWVNHLTNSSASVWFWYLEGLHFENHYNDVIMSAMVSQITSLTIVYSVAYSRRIKEYTKAPRHWPLCGEFTGDRWIPRTKASNVENVSIWWRHHDVTLIRIYMALNIVITALYSTRNNEHIRKYSRVPLKRDPIL